MSRRYKEKHKEKMIEIHAEAYYRALMRMEQEKSDSKDHLEEKRDKWYINLLLVLNVIFWPWKINKHIEISNRIHDNLLVVLISGLLFLSGFLLWLFGMLTILYMIYQVAKEGGLSISSITFPIALWTSTLGSSFIRAGSEFSKETDSNRIYAYSACIIALISCVVSIVTLVYSVLLAVV